MQMLPGMPSPTQFWVRLHLAILAITSRQAMTGGRMPIAVCSSSMPNGDITVICETPKVKPHREGMRVRTAELLDLPLEAVSVKATTTEGLGFTGRREGIAAEAVVTLYPTTTD